MKLNDYFKEFIGKISLNPSREKRIEDAVQAWSNLFKNDEEINSLFTDLYLQGSYATEMAIKPKNGEEFDVDTVLLLEFDSELEAKDALNFVFNRMLSKEAYKEKVIKKDRCVRVNYAGDFHLDVVPAKPTEGESILIPCKKDNEWVETNPTGFIDWCKSKKVGFTRVVRIMKYWRDNKVGEETAPKSILLTTLAGHNFVTASSDAESLVLTLEELVKNLDNYIVDGEPYIANPSLDEENLARDWDKQGFDRFKKKLQRFAEKTRDALDDNDKDSSIKKWRDIFGTEFPSELTEAAEHASKIATGAVFVNSKGHVNDISGQKVPGHRFYGGSY